MSSNPEPDHPDQGPEDAAERIVQEQLAAAWKLDEATQDVGEAVHRQLVELKRARGSDDESLRILRSLRLKMDARVYGLARSVLRDGRNAEEVREDTFVKVGKGIGGYREVGGAGPGWILTIALNTTIDLWRKLRSRDLLAPPTEVDDSVSFTKWKAPDTAPYDELIQDALSALNEEDQLILQARDRRAGVFWEALGRLSQAMQRRSPEEFRQMRGQQADEVARTLLSSAEGYPSPPRWVTRLKQQVEQQVGSLCLAHDDQRRTTLCRALSSIAVDDLVELTRDDDRREPRRDDAMQRFLGALREASATGGQREGERERDD